MLRRTLAGLVALALLAGCSTSNANPSTDAVGLVEALPSWRSEVARGPIRL